MQRLSHRLQHARGSPVVWHMVEQCLHIQPTLSDGLEDHSERPLGDLSRDIKFILRKGYTRAQR